MSTWSRRLKNIKPDMEKALEHLRPGAKVAFFDTETTGLEGVDGQTEESIKIIQFSAAIYKVVARGGRLALVEESSFSTLVNPRESVSEKVLLLTGMSQEELLRAPLEEHVIRQIVEYMGSAEVWAAYNAPYDMRRLDHACRRCGVCFRPASSVLDVLPMAQGLVDKSALAPAFKQINEERGAAGEAKLKSPGYKLEVVTRTVAPQHRAKFHDSLEDVRATAVCAEAFLNLYASFKAAGVAFGEKKIEVQGVRWHADRFRQNCAFELKVGGAWQKWPKWRALDYEWAIQSSAKAEEVREFGSLDLADVESQVFRIAKEKGIMFFDSGKQVPWSFYRFKPMSWAVPTMNSLTNEFFSWWQKNTEAGLNASYSWSHGGAARPKEAGAPKPCAQEEVEIG